MVSPLRVLRDVHFPAPLTATGIAPPSGLPVVFKTGETEGVAGVLLSNGFGILCTC